MVKRKLNMALRRLHRDIWETIGRSAHVFTVCIHISGLAPRYHHLSQPVMISPRPMILFSWGKKIQHNSLRVGNEEDMKLMARTSRSDERKKAKKGEKLWWRRSEVREKAGEVNTVKHEATKRQGEKQIWRLSWILHASRYAEYEKRGACADFYMHLDCGPNIVLIKTYYRKHISKCSSTPAKHHSFYNTL